MRETSNGQFRARLTPALHFKGFTVKDLRAQANLVQAFQISGCFEILAIDYVEDG